jgi:hypothetical protein
VTKTITSSSAWQKRLVPKYDFLHRKEDLRRLILHKLHQRARSKAPRRVWTIDLWVRNCLSCGQAGIARHSSEDSDTCADVLSTSLLLLEIIPKIPRASTDATGASLTIFEVENRKCAGNFVRWWVTKSPRQNSDSGVSFELAPFLAWNFRKESSFTTTAEQQVCKSIVPSIPFSILPNNDLTVGGRTKCTACPSQAMLCKAC